MSGFSNAYTMPVIDANLILGALKFNRFLAWVLMGGVIPITVRLSRAG